MGMTKIDNPNPSTLAESGPLPAPTPVDYTATTRRSRLAADRVPHLVRSVWSDLTPRQRANVIGFARAVETWDGMTEQRRDELIQQRLDRFAGENAGRVDDIRRRNAITEQQEAAVEAKQAERAEQTKPVITLENRAVLAGRVPTSYVVQCDGCSGWRAVRPGRPAQRFCDSCAAGRRREEDKRRAARLAMLA